MESSNRTKWLLGLFVALFLFIISFTSANAQTITYHPLRYGTNQTSMADGYFVKPANVVVKNHLYYVTMEIKTAKSLSSFPVKVNWVNGKVPLNVRRMKDRAGNSLMYYSFYANNFKKRINAELAIDVPKVYKAHHLISFKFSTAGLPSLGHSHVVATPKKTPTTPKASTSASTKSQQTSSQPKAKQPKKTKKTANNPKKASSTKKKQPKAKHLTAKKASSKPSKSSSNLTKPAQKTSSKPQSKKSGVPWIVGGVTVIAGLSAGLWIYFKH